MGSHKKRRKSETTSSDTSSDTDEDLKKRKKHKSSKKMNKRRRDSSTSSETSTTSSDTSSSSSDDERKLKKQKKKEKGKKLAVKKNKEEECTDVPIHLMEKSKAMAPMTKEEWEKRQNTVKRVYDESTGRHRLIKGDGEVIEEIVSKDRHKAINQQATKGDGDFFQSQMSSRLKK